MNGSRSQSYLCSNLAGLWNSVLVPFLDEVVVVVVVVIVVVDCSRMALTSSSIRTAMLNRLQNAGSMTVAIFVDCDWFSWCRYKQSRIRLKIYRIAVIEYRMNVIVYV